MVKIEYRYVFWERKLVNRMKMGTLFLFCLNIFFFLHCTSEATYMFSRTLNKLHLPCSLTAWFFLLEPWVFESCVIAANESLRCPRCEKMDLKITQSLLERVQYWTTKEFVGPEGFFWRTADIWAVQNKQRINEQLSLNKNTAVNHSGNNTELRIKRM